MKYINLKISIQPISGSPMHVIKWKQIMLTVINMIEIVSCRLCALLVLKPYYITVNGNSPAFNQSRVLICVHILLIL